MVLFHDSGKLKKSVSSVPSADCCLSGYCSLALLFRLGAAFFKSNSLYKVLL